MPDSKITALTSIGASTDPANDPLVLVDVSDTSMAATGTTKKVTLNQLLGASGTATLASATITGDLTVDTSTLKVDSANNRVGIGTASPALPLDVVGGIQVTSGSAGGLYQLAYGASASSRSWRAWNDVSANGDFQISTSTTRTGSTYSDRYRIDVTGIHEWFNTSGTAMTLNSTGLGVGGSPQDKLTVVGASFLRGAAAGVRIGDGGGYGFISAYDQTISTAKDLVLQSGGGNVGVGVTPSALNSSYKGIQIGGATFIFNNTTGASNSFFYTNAFQDAANNTVYRVNGRSSGYLQLNGEHRWYYDSGTQIANANCSFTQAMTLDASGNLLVGQTTAGLDANGGFYLRNANNSGGSSIIINHKNGVLTNNSYAEFSYNGSIVGNILQNGTTGVTFNSVSDYRLKESVSPLSGGLARVNALKPSIYKWKSDGSNGEGFIAHELAEVVPLAVTGEKDAVNEDGSIKPQGVDLSRVVPILVAAIKELTSRVEALEA